MQRCINGCSLERSCHGIRITFCTCRCFRIDMIIWWLLVSSASKPVEFRFLIPPSPRRRIVCHFLSRDIVVMAQISWWWPFRGCTPKARNAACLLLEAHKFSVTLYLWEYFGVWIPLLLPLLFVFVITGPLLCCCSVVCLVLPCVSVTRR